MNGDRLAIVLDPALVEEAVLLAMRGHAGEARFRGRRDSLYLLADDERERAFAKFHLSWFSALELDRPIRSAVDELPILARCCARSLAKPAPARSEEGADLLVATGQDGGVERTVLMRLRPASFGDLDAMLALLRAELLHVADMLDPGFGYEPALPRFARGPAYEHLVRERYHVLWTVSIAGRLARRGVAGSDARAEAYRNFAAAFPLGEATDGEFARFFDGAARTHAEMAEFAAAPRAPGQPVSFIPGTRCPLCRFPTYALEPAPEGLPSEVTARITSDFPAWQPHHGLCCQCADLYRANFEGAG